MMDYEDMLKGIKANPMSSIWRVSGELRISQSSVVCHLHDFTKSILSGWIVPHITKVWQNFCLNLVLQKSKQKVKIIYIFT